MVAKTATPWRCGEALFANPQRKPASPSDWQPPTGDTRPVIVVGRRELTCIKCGETFGAAASVNSDTDAFCWRCGGKAGVPTVSYLEPHEYWIPS